MLKGFGKKRTEVEQEQKNNASHKTAEQRIKIDIQNFEENKMDNVKLEFPHEGIITQFHMKIIPNKQSMYHDSLITFSFKIPEDYPYSPPDVKCINKILHPNIDKNGNVCLSLLRAGWKPIYVIYQVAVGLLHLLENIRAADIEEPLDADAATLMNKDIEEFKKVVQDTIKGKAYFGRQFDNVAYKPK